MRPASLNGTRCLELSPQLWEQSLSLQEGLPSPVSDILQAGDIYSFDPGDTGSRFPLQAFEDSYALSAVEKRR